jgi:hypothetical protein
MKKYMVNVGPYTPQHLMQKATAWFATDKRYQATKDQQPKELWVVLESQMAANVIRRVILPGDGEKRMVRCYAKPDKMEMISEMNAAVEHMIAPGPSWSTRITLMLRYLGAAILTVISIAFFLRQFLPTMEHVYDAYNGDRYTWLAALRLAYVFSAQVMLLGSAWSLMRRTRSAGWWTKSLLTGPETEMITSFSYNVMWAFAMAINGSLVAFAPVVVQSRKTILAVAYGVLCLLGACTMLLMFIRASLRQRRQQRR